MISKDLQLRARHADGSGMGREPFIPGTTQKLFRKLCHTSSLTFSGSALTREESVRMLLMICSRPSAIIFEGGAGIYLVVVRNVNEKSLKRVVELSLEETRGEADTQGNADLLTHVVHADGCCHLLLRGGIVETDELRRQDDTCEETEWERC